ncbi:flagellar assembly protein FliX [Luteithermobacter gelatinilyticus]|uniref:flagellar assembly protein FliX n=1 Tax=Luteithermobacter gelatinilyticus TaxID=2582913 RepID=UPI001106E8A2|nr:flagellar assembly protein FliX [Luteithermobacter gelatinilyticus]
MEIKGPGKISTPGVSRKKDKKATDKAGFQKQLSTEETSASAGLSGTAPLTAVTSLLALQEAGTATDGRSRGVARAEELLDHLEAIRTGLLIGQIPVQKLRDVAKVVNQQRGVVNDKALESLLDDIELRVKVELAKLEMID